MEYRNHGGGCCGIKHIYGFPTLGPANREAEIRNLDSILARYDADYSRASARVMEVILTDSQTRHWNDILVERGFVKVARWLNANSGNYCNAYYRYKNPANERTYGSIEFFGAAPAQPVAPPEVRVSATEYYAHLRNNGRRGPFSAADEARAAYPRCRRFERRQIMSDGSSVWADV